MRPYRALLAPLALITGMTPAFLGAQTRQARPDNTPRSDEAAPVVDVWLDQFTYVSGQRIRASFESENGAYITIVRVTTDGRLYVLYPRRPDQQRRYASNRDNSEIPFTGEPAYYVNEPPGTGFVFAIASFDRFDYSRYSWGSQWRDPRLATYLADPFAVVNSFVNQTLDVRSAYTFDYEQYEVNRGGRYAGRFRYGNRFYGDDAYYGCVQQFGLAADYYCRTYGVVYGVPVLIGRTVPSSKPTAASKGMKVKPLVLDPLVPVPERLNPPTKTDRAGSARASSKSWESMRRSEAPKVEPRIRELEPTVRSEPVQTQRYEPRSEPRSEPRVVSPEPRVFREQPRYEAPRVEHRVEQPRVEQPRVEQHRTEQPRVEQRQHVESHPSPKVSVPVKDQN
jgi:hypothetical protein